MGYRVRDRQSNRKELLSVALMTPDFHTLGKAPGCVTAKPAELLPSQDGAPAMTRAEAKEMVVMIGGIAGLVILGLTMAIFLPLLLSAAHHDAWP